ncbi:MAG: Ig-like domain-containing protein, partial [Treponema sp.]|nr:Ig-like domain-containing protein [Treponema sp.]
VTVTLSDGTKVNNATWESDNSSIVSVDNEGNVTALKAGTATITATYTAGGVEKNDSITITVKNVIATPVSVEISNKTENSITAGNTKKYSVTVTLSDGTKVNNATWESDNSSIVSVDNNGNVTALKAGTATITATYTAGGVEKHDSVTITVKNVIATPVSVVISNKTENSITTGNTKKYSVTVTLSDGTKVYNATWESDNSSIVSVNNDGNVTALKAGTATITATYTAGGVEKNDSVSITVTDAPVGNGNAGISIDFN